MMPDPMSVRRMPRAALAALTLQTLGFTHVANLEGGFVAWKEAGLPWIEHHADL